ncbi:hypothetical protein ACHAPG_007011 [Botrytis cinerea]
MTSNVLLDLETFCKVFTINIGRNLPGQAKCVKVSVALLATQSFFFKTASSQPWIKGENVIDLPDVSRSTFEVFLVWLYTADITHASVFQLSVNPETPGQGPSAIEQLSKIWHQLIDCYLMADYIQAPRYTNFVMNVLIAKLKEFEEIPVDENFPSDPLCNSCVKTIEIVWNETVSTSPLRKLILHSLGSTCHAPWNMTKTLFFASRTPYDSPKVPHEFLEDFLEQSFKSSQLLIRVPASWFVQTTYHVEEKLP